MNILCDYHHSELYESILRVFEDRLGASVYRPIGEEWFTNGYWQMGTPETVKQYLGFDWVKEQESGIWVEDGLERQDYYRDLIKVYDRMTPHKRVTFEKAKEMNWDIVITTYPGYDQCVAIEEFREKHCPRAKHILQLGNIVHRIPPFIKNVMNSTGVDHSRFPNVVDYYQEFDVNPLYSDTPINDGRCVLSFVYFNSHHRGDVFEQLETMMPEWIFKEHGCGNRDGPIHKYVDQCKLLRDTGFLWHVKHHGDGYGYNIHRAFYIGRPVIMNFSTVYKDHRLAKLGFLKDGETIIDFDTRNPLELRSAIINMQVDWKEKSQYIYTAMRKLIDFNEEENKIRTFLENLQ